MEQKKAFELYVSLFSISQILGNCERARNYSKGGLAGMIAKHMRRKCQSSMPTQISWTPTKSQNPTNLGQAGPTTTQCYSYKGTTRVYKPCPAGWK